jgi:myo-inositol 2-dehydrogenase / D-chiro-inositol 1-dehydrogenase
VAARPPRVALYGAGWIAQAHAAATRQNGYELVAVASRSATRTAEQAATLSARPATYTDLPGDADVVVVATPPQCHADDAIRMLQAGAAVLLEKPLCTTLADADRLVAAAQAHGDRLLYAENLAYSPVVLTLLRRTPSLGPLTHLEVRAQQGLPTWGAFTTDEWGGGALFDLGAHPLSIAMLLANAAGAGRPTSVRAHLRGGVGHNSDEHADVVVTYSSGLVAKVVSSWQAGPEAQWDAQVASATGVLRAELVPSPSLEHNGDPVALPPPTTTPPEIGQFGYLGQLRALVDDCAARREPAMNASFGRTVLDVTCAAYWSAGRDGAPTALPFAGPRDLTPLQLWRSAAASVPSLDELPE